MYSFICYLVCLVINLPYLFCLFSVVWILFASIRCAPHSHPLLSPSHFPSVPSHSPSVVIILIPAILVVCFRCLYQFFSITSFYPPFVHYFSSKKGRRRERKSENENARTEGIVFFFVVCTQTLSVWLMPWFSFTVPAFMNGPLVHLGIAIRMWTLRLFLVFQKESSGSSSSVKSSTSTVQETSAHCETHSVGSAAKTMPGGCSTSLDTSLHSATTYGRDYDGIRHRRPNRGDPESKVAWTGKQLTMRISHDSVSLWPEPMQQKQLKH